MLQSARLLAFLPILFASTLFAATTPTLTVYSPVTKQGNGFLESFNGPSPIHFVASATSPDCVGGIAAFEIDSGDGQVAYVNFSSYIDVQLPLPPAFYKMTVKVFDNCGGVTSLIEDTLVTDSTGTVTVNQPERGFSYDNQVHFDAASTTTCAKGVSAMGVYTDFHQLAFSANSSTLNTTLNLPSGTYNHMVVQMWDNCGGAVAIPVPITVAANGIPPQSDVPRLVYMPRSGSPWIDGFWVNPTSCALNTIPGSPFPAHFKPRGVAADPKGQFVFAVNQDSQDINIYRIDPNSGGLTQIPDSPVQIPANSGGHPMAIAVDGLGRFVYVSLGEGSGDGKIVGYALDRSSGKLTLIPGSPFRMNNDNPSVPIWANSMTTNLRGRVLETSNGPSVSTFNIDINTGALTESPGSPTVVPGRNLTFAGTQDIIFFTDSFIYTANAESSISGWSDGPLPGSPWTDPTLPSGVRNSPASITLGSNFVFGLDSGGEQISVWSLDTTSGEIAFLRDEHNGQITPDPLDKIRTVPNSNCLVTSKADALSFDPLTGVTTIVSGSPFPLPGSGQEPGIAIAP
jgi:hypothetical protein